MNKKIKKKTIFLEEHFAKYNVKNLAKELV